MSTVPPTRFVKAVQKVKPDPAYYQKIITRMEIRRGFFLDLACAIEEVEPDAPEARHLRRKVTLDYQPRLESAVRCLGVAHFMVDERRAELKRLGKIPKWAWPTAEELFPK